MARKKQATRDKLIAVATELFLKKGVDRVGVREIAAQANINLSLMNYYFKTKERLFETIVEGIIREKGGVLKAILDSDIPLEEKIRSYTSAYIDTLIESPLLTPFILSILHRNPERMKAISTVENLYNSKRFCEQVDALAAAGKIRPVDPEHLYISMISLINFPFAIRDLIEDRNKFTRAQFVAFVEERKALIADMLLDYIRIRG